LKVSAVVKVAMQCFEIFGWWQMLKYSSWLRACSSVLPIWDLNIGGINWA